MARNWDSLSDSYRKRLERSGISRSDYQSGASLEKARGHRATPEHPERAENNKEKYKEYLASRDKIITQINGIKREIFGGGDKWSNTGSRRNIRVDPATGSVRTIQELRAILDASKAARGQSAGKSASDIWSYITDEWEDYASAFWYH